MKRGPIENLVSLLKAKRSGKGWEAKCPAHEDRKPSLCLNEGADGRALIKCQAGCPTDAVMRALGLTIKDLFPTARSRNGSKLVATYDYTDESGHLLYQVCRFKPKDFRQRRRDWKGRWIWNLDGVRRVLYRLPEVMRAQTVAITEGEKDAHNLANIDITATCNPGGAHKWRGEYSETLRGKDVLIFGDDDKDGREHVDQVVESLAGVAKSIKKITLPDGFKDVSDYIASLPAKTAAQSIAELINATPVISSEDEVVDDFPDPLNDLRFKVWLVTSFGGSSRTPKRITQRC
jgi:putative DNA primase/helicase